MNHTYGVVMAGGKGERFWPLSTKSVPKPFVKLIGDKTMIQRTVERLLRLVPVEHVYVVLGEEHADVAREQLPGLGPDQFIVEPAGRDTAPCIGFAATVLDRGDPEAVMIVVPADHHIPDPEPFVKTIADAVQWSRRGDYLVTAGIRPTRPEKGYGYIHAGGRVQGPGVPCHLVSRFVEKPDEAKAAQYLSEGDYYWNSGIFVWRTRALLRGMELHMPELHRGLKEIGRAIEAGDSGTVASLFKGFQRISIDYGLMEKADNVLMVKADFAWDDVGTWSSLRRVMPLDEEGNCLRGGPICIDTRNCVIYGENIKVGAVGVSNLIIVASDDGVLVCEMGRDQDTRQIARMFEDEGAEG